ncbi:MAG: hypothetical protein AB1898_22145 [Acidobacteriota bacterium]
MRRRLARSSTLFTLLVTLPFWVADLSLLGLTGPEVRRGSPVDLVPFGTLKSWTVGPPGQGTVLDFEPGSGGLIRLATKAAPINNNSDDFQQADVGVEWQEARDIHEVRVVYLSAWDAPAPSQQRLQYWLETWPADPKGGWTLVDSPYQGHWADAKTDLTIHGNEWVYRFQELTEAENPNAGNAPGVQFRRTLKIRLLLNGLAASRMKSFRCLGGSRWAEAEVVVTVRPQSSKVEPASLQAYNGYILSHLQEPGAGTRFRFAYTETSPANRHDETLLTVVLPTSKVSFRALDLIQEKRLTLAGGDVTVFLSGQQDTGSGTVGETVRRRLTRTPEQTLRGALAGIPRLSKMEEGSGRPRLYVPMSPPAARQKFLVTFNGHFFVRKWSTRVPAEDTPKAKWPGETLTYLLATGSQHDLRQREDGAVAQVEEGYLPILHSSWTTDGIDYHETAWTGYLDGGPLDSEQRRGDEPTVLFVSVAAKNARSSGGWAHLYLETSPSEPLVIQDDCIFAEERFGGEFSRRLRACFDAPPGVAVRAEAHGVQFSRQLQPGGSASLVFKVPYVQLDVQQRDQLHRLSASGQLVRVREYWKRQAASAARWHIPDPAIARLMQAILVHNYLNAYKDPLTGQYYAPAATVQYGVFATEAMPQSRFLDYMGHHHEARRYLETFLYHQGQMPLPGLFRTTRGCLWSAGVHSHRGYNPANGWVAWRIAEHYRLTQDKAWLRRIADQLVDSCHWTIREREATQLHDSSGERLPGFGLLPAGRLEDNGQWYQWFMVNGYHWRGLAEVAEVLAEIQHPAAEPLRREANAYREDIWSELQRSVSFAPVVKLRDGRFVPSVPVYVNQRFPYGWHYSDIAQIGWFHEILMSPIHLAEAGVVDSNDPLMTALIDHTEDNLFQSSSHGLPTARPEEEWFSRGGLTLQPALLPLPLVYLRRDEVPPALRIYFNTYAALIHPEVNALSEWFRDWGTGGGPFYKTPDESAFGVWTRFLLVREAQDRLLLGFGTPREWMKPGSKVGVEGAPTTFGLVTVLMEPFEEQTLAQVTLPDSPQLASAAVRFRHYQGRKIRSVRIDGQAWNGLQEDGETVRLPPKSEMKVIVQYGEAKN